MNLNIISYLIFSIITIYIIIWVGRSFHKAGRIFILRLFHQNEAMADTTNNILLLAYYLFNIGYAILQFSSWQQVESISMAISSIAGMSGMLISILAVTNYFNMALIYLLSKRAIGYKLSQQKK